MNVAAAACCACGWVTLRFGSPAATTDPGEKKNVCWSSQRPWNGASAGKPSCWADAKGAIRQVLGPSPADVPDLPARNMGQAQSSSDDERVELRVGVPAPECVTPEEEEGQEGGRTRATKAASLEDISCGREAEHAAHCPLMRLCFQCHQQQL